MIKTNWISTNEYYHAVINAPNISTREQIYLEKFILPWKPMMDMMAGMFQTNPDDPFAGAKAWHWMLPEHLTEMPETLRILESVNAWETGKAAMEKAAQHFAPYADQIPIQEITGWLVLADPSQSDPGNRGYTGATDWTQPRFVGQYYTANDYNLPRLPGLLVHEMQHLIRFSVHPFNPMTTTVADYIVAEGTAESFATALFGEDNVGFFVTDISQEDLQKAKTLIKDGLFKNGFDVIRNYIFGDEIVGNFGMKDATLGMPRYGGYAVGYHVVQAYLKKTGKNIEETSLLPGEEIVRESGYFD